MIDDDDDYDDVFLLGPGVVCFKIFHTPQQCIHVMYSKGESSEERFRGK